MAATFSDDEGGTMSDINVTPLVDVVLVLLIVFMVTMPTMVSKAAKKVDLPETVTAGGAESELDENVPLDIYVRRESDGAMMMYLGEDPITLALLGTHVKTLGPERGQKMVRLAADKGIPYGEIVKVMDLLASNGMTKLSLSTKYVQGSH